jgi:2-methylcitrate dehydratase PrpD
MQAHLEGLPALPVQIAAAARSAVNAFDIAQIGLPGPRGSIDGPFGYLSLFEGGSDLDPILSALEERPRILEVSWKPFPTGRAAHGAIVATQRLMQEQGLKAEDLDRLVYSAPPLIERLVGRPARPGMSPAYARLCFAYLGAVVLSRGTVDLGDFSPERLSDPAILAMAERILVVSDGGHDPAAFTPAVATATLLDGRRLSVEVVSQLGSPQAPLTPAQHLAKAQACMTFAGLGSRHEALSRLMDRFAEAPDAGQALREALTPH